jgi:hypothetical protein
VTAALLVFAATGWVVGGQLLELTGELPEYQANLSSKIRSVRGADSPIFYRANEMARKLFSEATGNSEPIKDLPLN